jgi:hypothetical protein
MWCLRLENPVEDAARKLLKGTVVCIPMKGAVLGREPTSEIGFEAQNNGRFVAVAPQGEQSILTMVENEHATAQPRLDGVLIKPMKVESICGKEVDARTWVDDTIIGDTEGCVAIKGARVAFGNQKDTWIVEEFAIDMDFEEKRRQINTDSRIKQIQMEQQGLLRQQQELAHELSQLESQLQKRPRLAGNE